MKIKSIKIKGWRSYNDLEGIELNDLKKINLIIGPNNSGKSNLLKFFQKVWELGSKKIGSGTSSIASIKATKGDSSDGLSNQDFWNTQKHELCATIEIDNLRQASQYSRAVSSLHESLKGELDFHISFLPEYTSQKRTLVNWNCCIIPTLKYGGEKIQLAKYEENHTQFLKQNKEIGAHQKWVPTTNNDNDYHKQIEGYSLEFLDSLHFVSAIRDHEGKNNVHENYFNGTDLIKKLSNVKNNLNDREKWRSFENQLQKWMGLILGERELRIDFAASEIEFILMRNERELPQFLKHLGTGVVQSFMLLTHLLFNQDKHLNVFIDEPENNLHPTALVSLINILGEEFPNHRYFISTHSSALLDMVKDDWTVHKVEMYHKTGSKISPCQNVVSKHEVLDALGVRASQILQSNYIIWVEGPSDRLYLRKWIEIVSENSIREGKHYSFIFYGGAVLHHVGIDYEGSDEELELLDLFKTSRYGTIVLDSDKKTAQEPTKQLVTKIKGRLEEMDSNNFKVWELQVREIENYLPTAFWQDIMAEGRITKKQFKAGSGSNLKIISPPNFKIGPFEDFAEKLCGFYQNADSNDQLSQEEKLNIKRHHDSIKVPIAKHFVQSQTESHLLIDEELRGKLNDLISRIKIANGIG